MFHLKVHDNDVYMFTYIDKVLIELISSCLAIFFGLLGYVENFKLLFSLWTSLKSKKVSTKEIN